MADFDSLYAEDGLKGIIPYAFGLAGPGYQFLCDKLKNGVNFWIIVSKRTKIPFYAVDDEKIYFSLYTSEDLANKKCDELAADNFYTEAVLFQKLHLVQELWRRYRDLGLTHLKLDGYIWVNILDLTHPASYDGFLSNQAPLRNARLNIALYYAMQHFLENLPCDPLLTYLWETLKESYFYVLVRPIENLKPGQVLSKENMDVHRLELEDGTYGFAVFTDNQFVSGYAAALGLSPEEYLAGFTPDFPSLVEYMQINHGLPAVVNPCFGSFVLSLDFFSELNTIALNQEAARQSK